MLYLLDANVLITANSLYYPIDQVPEFWSWLQYQAVCGHVKIPIEILEELLAGRPDEPLIDWLSVEETQAALTLDETIEANLVQHVVTVGYASDLTDDEILELGRDPFLIAYALFDSTNRCVVTTEVSKPSRRRQNRKIPNVCDSLGVRCCGPFDLNRELGFRTGWRRSG